MIRLFHDLVQPPRNNVSAYTYVLSSWDRAQGANPEEDVGDTSLYMFALTSKKLISQKKKKSLPCHQKFLDPLLLWGKVAQHRTAATRIRH